MRANRAVLAIFIVAVLGVVVGPELHSQFAWHDPVNYPVQIPGVEDPSPMRVACGDMTGDGWEDVVVTVAARAVLVFPNNGDGTLGTPMGLELNSNAHAVALGDLDGNGVLDVVITTWDPLREMRTLMNDGTGRLTESEAFALEEDPAKVYVSDFDQDSDLDVLVATEYEPSYLELFLNRGDGTFEAQAPLEMEWRIYASAVGDLNGDGAPDMIQAPPLRVWLNDGDGNFTWTQTLDTQGDSAGGCSMGDFDGDGDLDAVVASRDDRLEIRGTGYRNNGSGVFEAGVPLHGSHGPYEVHLSADWDNDGDDDASYTGEGWFTQWLSRGDFAFTRNQTIVSGNYSNDLAAADLNHDGWPEAIFCNGHGDRISVLVNRRAAWNENLEVQQGEILAGDIGATLLDDDDPLRLRSLPDANDREASRVQIDSHMEVQSPAAIEVVAEFGMSQEDGQFVILVWNWTTSQFDEVGTYLANIEDRTASVTGLSGSDYVSDSGAVRLVAEFHVDFLNISEGFDARLDSLIVMPE